MQNLLVLLEKLMLQMDQGISPSLFSLISWKYRSVFYLHWHSIQWAGL